MITKTGSSVLHFVVLDMLFFKLYTIQKVLYLHSKAHSYLCALHQGTYDHMTTDPKHQAHGSLLSVPATLSPGMAARLLFTVLY